MQLLACLLLAILSHTHMIGAKAIAGHSGAPGAGAIAKRQISRGDVVARASRSRPRRDTPSQIICNPLPGSGQQFYLQYSSPTTRYIQNQYRVEYTDFATATLWTLDANSHIVAAATPADSLQVGIPLPSLVLNNDFEGQQQFAPLNCAFVAGKLVCNPSNNPVTGIFQTCDNLSATIPVYHTQLEDSSCTRQDFTAVCV